MRILIAVRVSDLARAALAIPLAVWTLPQTLAGLVFVVVRVAQGARLDLCAFGPFAFLVVHAPGPSSSGISLGVVVFASSRSILKHEFSHLVTGLWLSWLYLPVYGVEYLCLGHDRSPHERITCWLSDRLPWRWRCLRAGEERDEVAR